MGRIRGATAGAATADGAASHRLITGIPGRVDAADPWCMHADRCRCPWELDATATGNLGVIVQNGQMTVPIACVLRSADGRMVVEDFASAVLVAAVRLAVKVGDPAVSRTVLARDALVPLEDKRSVLRHVADSQGLLPLLRVAGVIPALLPHPVVTALRAADHPLDLLQRWSRLERFAHSRHRVMVCETASNSVLLHHLGPGHAPPEPEEDAVVLGVLTGLMVDIGAQELTVELLPGTVILSDGAFRAPPAGLDPSRWWFRWAGQNRTAAAARAQGDRGLPDRARAIVIGDPARRWSVGDVAAALSVSTRHFQRQLQPGGGFAALLGSTRSDGAAQYLVGTDHQLSEIGFVCG
jgi:AraC-like DNA-binding protein